MKMIKFATIMMASLGVLLFPADPAEAACSNPAGIAGKMIYNGDHKVMQYCNGTVWVSMDQSAAACIAPPDCPNIGDVCDDGNTGNDPDPLFAGFMVYNDPDSTDTGECKPLYVTNDNQSTTIEWKTSTGSDDIATDSIEDGKINGSQVANSSTFPAFKLCKDLNDGGFSDWYLPGRDELHLLWKNKSAIDANAAGNFTTNSYWSSTETSAINAWAQSFGGGGHGSSGKTNNLDVRCVRRD